jgi:hypothetical protein
MAGNDCAIKRESSVIDAICLSSFVRKIVAFYTGYVFNGVKRVGHTRWTEERGITETALSRGGIRQPRVAPLAASMAACSSARSHRYRGGDVELTL